MADIVYLYDDLGRLVRVIRGDGQAATYHYDAVGNILQITRESGVSQATTIDTQSATTAGQGQVVPLTITGTNLSGATLVCASPGITVQNVRTDLGQMTLELVVAQTAPTGPSQCEVRGVTSNPLAFSVITTIPAYLAGAPVSVLVAESPARAVGSSVSVLVAETPLASNNSVGGLVSVLAGSAAGEVAVGMVAVSFQPVITSVSPASGAPGTPTLSLRVLGAGFDGATAVSFRRNNAVDSSITVVTFTVTPDGREIDVEIAIAPSAPLGLRAIQITTPTGTSTALGTAGNVFNVQ